MNVVRNCGEQVRLSPDSDDGADIRIGWCKFSHQKPSGGYVTDRQLGGTLCLIRRSGAGRSKTRDL